MTSAPRHLQWSRSGEASFSILVSSIFFFFSSRRRHTRLQGDWSSDVCSSDLWAYEPHVPRYEYDPARAERLLDAAGFPRPAGAGGHAMRLKLTLKTSTEEITRSEERRVGKECRSRWSPYH